MKEVRPIRDALLSAIVILITCHLAIWTVTVQARDELLQEIQYYSKSVVQIAEKLTDKNTIKQLANADGQITPELQQSFDSMIRNHRTILDANADLRYIYTMVEKDNKLYFTSDAEQGTGTDDKSATRETTAKPMEEYTEATDTLKRAFRIRALQVEDQPYTDQWGTTLSAYAPLFDSNNEFVGMIGVDYGVAAYDKAILRIWSAFGNGSMLSVLLATLIFYYVYNLRMHRARYQNLRIKFNAQMQEVTESLADSSTFIRQKASGIVSAVNFAARNTTKAHKSINGASVRIEQISIVSVQLANSLNELKQQADAYRQFLSEVSGQLAGAQSSITGLTQANKRINDAMALIPKITAKINMVALNATIEAARAGEVGKGFVVVANEVKTLAKQTDEATAKIAECLRDSQLSAAGTVTLIETVDQVIHRVRGLMDSMDHVISEQSSMLHDINTDIVEVAESAKLIEDIVQDIDNVSNKVKVNTDELYIELETLEHKSEGLENKVNGFINQVENGKISDSEKITEIMSGGKAEPEPTNSAA